VLLGGQRVNVAAGSAVHAGPAWLVLRPEVVRVAASAGQPAGVLRGVVRDFADRGAGYAYRVAAPGLAEALKAEVSAEAAPPLPVGSEVVLSWDPSSCALLPR
jgi:hypothetical protein